MASSDLFKKRLIGRRVKTPLIVPSFSSTAFSAPSEMSVAIDSMRSHLGFSSLFSAYDISQNLVDKEIGISDVVIIDSGNYERRVLQDLGSPVSWTPSDHLATLNSIKPLTNLIIVNYDDPGIVEDQIRSAQNLFDRYPGYSTDFLIKPSSEKNPYIAIKAFEKNVDEISDFQMIGFTDNELGESFLDKCRNLVKIRRILIASDLDIPIHIFGCFDPLTVILMFLCGADVFDGLEWLRYGVKENLLVYNRSIPLLGRDWSIPDIQFRQKIAAETLIHMSDLNAGLRSFCESQTFDDLKINEETADLIKSFMTLVLRNT